jgi:hypothetical protein
MGSKQKSTTTSNQTQTAAPPSFTLPGLTDVAQQVTNAAATLPGLPAYSGPMIAQPNADMNSAAINAYTGAAGTAGQLAGYAQGQLPALTAAPTFGSSVLPTASFQPGTGGDLDAAIRASIDPVFHALTTQILPGIKSDALASGAYSGDRATAILPQMALHDATGQAENIAAQLGYQGYQANEDRRMNAFEQDQNRLQGNYGMETARGLGTGNMMTDRMAQLPGLIDTIMRMSAGQGDLLSQASGLDTAGRQASINDALARDQFSTTRPFQGLDIASQLLAELSGHYGTTTSNGTQTTVQKTGGLGDIAQAVLGAASLAGSFLLPGSGQALGALGALGKGTGTMTAGGPALAALFGGH